MNSNNWEIADNQIFRIKNMLPLRSGGFAIRPHFKVNQEWICNP